jgi:hypothetical protein
MSKPKKQTKGETKTPIIYHYQSRRLIPLGHNTYAEVFDEVVDPEAVKHSEEPRQRKPRCSTAEHF